MEHPWPPAIAHPLDAVLNDRGLTITRLRARLRTLQVEALPLRAIAADMKPGHDREAVLHFLQALDQEIP